LSTDLWIGLPSLALLVFINKLATGTNLVNDSRESRLPVRGMAFFTSWFGFGFA